MIRPNAQRIRVCADNRIADRQYTFL
jgi:hypothetical protein